MKIKNIDVDVPQIAEGLFAILLESDDQEYLAALAFGMLPAPIFNAFEVKLREKLISENARQMQCPVEEIIGHVDKKKLEEYVQAIKVEVAKAFYTVAKKEGILIV